MDTFISFIGFHDPVDPVSGSDGPILSLLRLRQFDRVILLDTAGANNRGDLTRRTSGIIRDRFPSTAVVVIETSFEDPTDYPAILDQLRPHLASLLETSDIEKDRFYIGIASGTPQMQTCWFLLVASSEFPAVLLQMNRPEHNGRYNEIDVRRPEFPVIHRHLGKIRSENQNIDDALDEIGIIGRSNSLMTAVDRTARFAKTDLPIIFLGEPGTGKELFALLAHRLSDRNGKKFLAVNCAAIPETLAESELFGSKKGAYTGAVDRAGKFRSADGGTMFLDEVGDLPLGTQAKLLRALQEGDVEPVGGEPVSVDVRLIVATNKDLKSMVREKQFRQDLYDRLSGGVIQLPPLRSRKRDIELLAHHFLILHAKEKVLTPGALRHISRHPWPGNVRELYNAVRRAAALCSGENITENDFELESDRIDHTWLPEPHMGFDMQLFLDETRKALIARALEIAEGNKSAASRLLGVTPQALSKDQKGRS